MKNMKGLKVRTTERKAAPVPQPFSNQLAELANDTQGIARRKGFTMKGMKRPVRFAASSLEFGEATVNWRSATVRLGCRRHKRPGW